MGLSFALIGGFFITYFYIQGKLEPYLEALSLGLIRKNSSRDKSLSDIRVSMNELKTLYYDLERHIDHQKGVFVGLGDQKKPVYILLKMLRESHVAILGATGNGKEVVSQIKKSGISCRTTNINQAFSVKMKGELSSREVILTDAHWAYLKFFVHPFCSKQIEIQSFHNLLSMTNLLKFTAFIDYFVKLIHIFNNFFYTKYSNFFNKLFITVE